jgi:hypothetical protein
VIGIGEDQETAKIALHLQRLFLVAELSVQVGQPKRDPHPKEPVLEGTLFEASCLFEDLKGSFSIALLLQGSGERFHGHEKGRAGSEAKLIYRLLQQGNGVIDPA